MVHLASLSFPDPDQNFGKIGHGRLGPGKGHVNLTLFKDSQSVSSRLGFRTDLVVDLHASEWRRAGSGRVERLLTDAKQEP